MTYRSEIQKNPDRLNFYIFKRKTYDHSYHLLEIANDIQKQIDSLKSFNKILSKQACVLDEMQKAITQWIKHCLQLKGNKEHVSMPNKEWFQIGMECELRSKKLVAQMKRDPHWIRRGFLISLVFPRSPTNKNKLKFNFPLMREEYRIEVPMGQVMVLKMLNVVHYTITKASTATKEIVNSWKHYIVWWWIALAGPRFLDQIRKFIRRHIKKLEKKLEKK